MEELTGQLFMAGFKGLSVDAHLRRLIIDEGVGGVILFSRNIESESQLNELTCELKELSHIRNPDYKLLISVDQEGGRVFRLPPPFRSYPSYRHLATGSESDTLKSAETLADELLKAGFNMNMAPVLDVDTNPKNPIIGDRSFGPDPELVGRLGTVVMEGFSKRGLIPVAKHFPGHGDTSEDSHTALPVLGKELSDLEQIELIPFRAAIVKGVKAIMTAHILFPKIDPRFPATISTILLKNLLRGTMNYRGVIISDDMEMKGICEGFSVEEIVRAGLNATLDIFLCCHTASLQLKYLAELKRSFRENSVLREGIIDSIKRVIDLKQRVGRPVTNPK